MLYIALDRQLRSIIPPQITVIWLELGRYTYCITYLLTYLLLTCDGCCGGVGELSVWEFSGNDRYYVCYDHFIGDPNCIHCVVFRLSDTPHLQRQQTHFWLSFLRARIAPAEPIGVYWPPLFTVWTQGTRAANLVGILGIDYWTQIIDYKFIID